MATAGLWDRGELRSLDLTYHRPGEVRAYWSGHAWQVGTARFWEEIAIITSLPPSFRIGATFREEVGVCMLGGWGMDAESGLSAFRRLRSEGLFESKSEMHAPDIEAILREPLDDTGRRYRFPKQRATRIAAALAIVPEEVPKLPHIGLRDWLTSIPGIGLKTASWIVRNHLDSNEVAVLDVHILRAGVVAGVFSAEWRVQHEYRLIEAAFLGWAQQADTTAAQLDTVMWSTLSASTSIARDILGTSSLHAQLAPVWEYGASI